MKRHPIYNSYGADGYLNNLRGEFYEISAKLRVRWLKKYRRRAAVLWLTGQSALEQQIIPLGVSKILWFYDWNTLGDSIMDLSQRQSLAGRYQVDICMPSGPAALFKGDPAFGQVYTDIAQCPSDYDFILLHDISARSIGMKLRRYYFKPWASMIRHQQGEQFARAALSAYRLSKLLQAPDLLARRPSIAPISPPIKPDETSVRIAVALGGIDPRRRYASWLVVLKEILAQWACAKPLRFVLIGSGVSAKDDLAQIPVSFLQSHCDTAIDLSGLLNLRDTIARCHVFLGADSGPMHLAEALDLSGVALFGHIRPEWRLLPGSRLSACFDPKTVNNIQPHEIVSSFVRIMQKSQVA